MKRDKQSPSEADRDDLARQVEALRHDLLDLQLEHDLLKKASSSRMTVKREVNLSHWAPVYATEF